MILAMAKVRIMGPRHRLDDVLDALQKLGTLHLGAPVAVAAMTPAPLRAADKRHRNQLNAALADTDQALEALGLRTGNTQAPAAAPTTGELARWVRLAWQTRRSVERLAAARAGLEEERALILRYRYFFSAFRSLLESESRWPNAMTYHVVLKRGDAGRVPLLRSSLSAAIGDEFQLYSQPLPSGETAVLLIVSGQAAAKVEQLLTEARVREMPVPAAFGGGSLTEAIPMMLDRLGRIPTELAANDDERAALARRVGPELLRARVALHDQLQRLDAIGLAGVTERAFILEGWVPTGAEGDLERGLDERCGHEIAVTRLGTEEWQAEQAPVVLSNPRIFRPFETLIGLLPLPRYGSIDPTPFVAVFFPALFGLMVGDIGYGIVLAAIGLIMHARTRPGTTARNIAEITGPCALGTVIGGVLYGEFFGNLGTRWFGLRPLLFNREEAVVPFLLLAVAIGVVHVVLGLILGVFSARGHPRQAAGRGVSAVMVLLVVLALLAATRVLPARFFSPAVIALLVAFPILIALEGVVAMIELLTTFGNILSYARIMALGIASVMLAVVANRMVGAMGSVLVGVVFALLFHVVNFTIAMFSPTVHALRLHYVEFFGKFYSPGGVRYQPFTSWTPVTSGPSLHSPSPRSAR